MRPGRGEGLALVVLAVVAAALQWPLREWWVEDAAISFSYARNLADGFGLVAYPGGERSEGYSNPLWVALLAGGWRLGVSPFEGSKLLGALLAAACVPLTWALALRLPSVRPGAGPDDRPRVVALLAAALVATNAQHAIWAASGLENPLFTFLLALGTWRVLVEAERGGFSWAAVAYLGAALTRPEGVVYAALGLGVAAWADLRAGRWRRVLGAAALIGVPLTAYHAVRYAYFALPYPLTYYAKILDQDVRALAWSARGWKYLRRWSTELGWLWAVPVVLAGAVGLGGRRVAGVAAWTALLGGALALPSGWDDRLRVAALVLSGAGLGATALVRGAPVRVLLVGQALIALAFEVRAGGDWMNGFRFLAVLAVPLAVTFAAGVGEIAARLPRLAGPVVAAGIALAPVAVHVPYTLHYAEGPELSPQFIRERARYYEKIARRVRLDRPWLALDHNQGGMMWWAPPHGAAIDSMGLTDVPFALHRRDQRYRRWFLLSPAVFDFAWVHKDSGSMYAEAKFRDQFVRLPMYKAANKRCKDAWMKRALLVADRWPGEARRVDLGEGVHVEGFTIDAPEVAAGRGLYVELGLSVDAPTDFGLQLVLDGPTTVRLPVEPGYGDLLPPTTWKAGEVFVGRYAVKLPKTLPTGTYALGFELRDGEGADDAQVAALALPDAPTAGPSTRFPDAVHLVERAEQRRRAEADVRRAERSAQAGDCVDAEAARREAIHHDALDGAWGAGSTSASSARSRPAGRRRRPRRTGSRRSSVTCAARAGGTCARRGPPRWAPRWRTRRGPSPRPPATPAITRRRCGCSRPSSPPIRAAPGRAGTPRRRAPRS
jgi:hypothetical protein